MKWVVSGPNLSRFGDRGSLMIAKRRSRAVGTLTTAPRRRGIAPTLFFEVEVRKSFEKNTESDKSVLHPLGVASTIGSADFIFVFFHDPRLGA